MAPGTDMTPDCTVLHGGCSKEEVGLVEDEDPESSENSSQAKAGKPPRNLSVMRHSMSQRMLVGTTDLVSKIQSIVLENVDVDLWFRGFDVAII